MLIKPEKSCPVVIDVQEKFMPAMQAPARVIRNRAMRMQSGARLRNPVPMTQQYPTGSGRNRDHGIGCF